MKSFKITIVVSLLLFGCHTVNESTVTSKAADNPGYPPAVEKRIERIINNLQAQTALQGVNESKSLTEQMEHYHTPGISIAVINEGKIEWARGFGKADLSNGALVDVHTLFEAGSVSKPIFALTVMKLKEKGMLDLDTDVNEYLKSWKVPKNQDWQPKITLRQLLSHTAGLTVHGFPGYLKTEPVPTVPQILNGDHPANTAAVKVNILPGTAFRYSGGGTTVAQLAVMDRLSKPFPDIVREELFEPLKLQYSTYQQPLPEALENMASTAYPYKNQPIHGRFHTYPEMAAAGLWTNPTELATLLIEVQKSLKGESALFKKETIGEMLTPQKVAGHIGIGFFLNGKGDSVRYGHGGWDEGFVTQVTAYRNLGMGAVVMVNSNEGYSLLDEIMRAIAIEYEWPAYIDEPVKFAEKVADDITSYVGVYLGPNENQFEIATANDTLVLVYQNQDPIQLLQTTKGEFRNNQFNFSLTFKEDKLHFNQLGRSVTYEKSTVSSKR